VEISTGKNDVGVVGWHGVVLGVAEIFFILGWKIAYRWRYTG
jgi:hypothetical protein